MAVAWESDRIRRDAVMQWLLLTALHADKNNISHRGYERELVVIYLVGGDVGDNEHTRKTCCEMLQVIAYHGRQQARDFLHTPNPITGNPKRQVGA